MPKQVDAAAPPDDPPPIPPGSNLPALIERRRRANRLGWVALAAAVAVIIVGVAVARNEIVSVWPPAVRLYDAVGLELDRQATAALTFRNVASRRIVEDGVSVLVVRGEIANEGDEPHEVPAIRIGLEDANDKEVHHWTVVTELLELAAGAITAFETRLESPPEGVMNVSVDFSHEGPG